MPTQLIVALVLIAVIVGVVLFARRKIKSGSGDATGGGGRPGADKH